MEPGIFSVPSKIHIPRHSVGKILFDKIQSQEKSSVAMVEANSSTVLTFGELSASSVNLAANLRNQLKIEKNTNLAIISENSPKFSVAFLSSLYLGAPVHLVNPGFTPYEIKKSLMMSKPKLVFCSNKSAAKILEIREECTFVQFVVMLDNNCDSGDAIFYQDLIKSQNFDFNFEKIDDTEEQVAYIANSSGTTGFPKGVLLTHENLRMNLCQADDYDLYQLDSNTVTCNITPFYHVQGCSLFYCGFYRGYKQIILDHFVPKVFLESIQKYRVNTIFIVPTLGNFLANNSLVDAYDLSSLKFIYSAAGMLKNTVEEKLLNKFNLEFFRQVYGLTENACAIFITSPTTPKNSCGNLTPGHSVKIVDPTTSELLGCNRPGEIRIRGALMKGYVNEPEKTRDAFDSDGFLRTGDLGYYDENGNFYIIDRLKDVIKYKSFQVAPLEIEEVLMQLPGVKDVAVVGKPDDRYGELPVAFVVRKEDLGEEEVKNHVAKFVSEAKRLHGGVRFVGEIPRNALGKILRKDLRDLLQ